MTTHYEMPVPGLGDTVLFSKDMRNFSDPCVGWVTSVGQSTISILTFTPGGFVSRTSVHHRCDPDCHGDHGWEDLGCWDFAPSTVALRELTEPPKPSEARRARETADK